MGGASSLAVWCNSRILSDYLAGSLACRHLWARIPALRTGRMPVLPGFTDAGPEWGEAVALAELWVLPCIQWSAQADSHSLEYQIVSKLTWASRLPIPASRSCLLGYPANPAHPPPFAMSSTCRAPRH